ncbi:hypothetical protein [Brevundimonas sp.]|uniref:hypothetical protein n=1 Tax=Brevundimonas sp. TaxID=1871086 RepID=UPI0035AD8D5E
MKAFRLLAGVAALALISTAAQAGDVYHASMSVPVGQTGPSVNVPGFGTYTATPPGYPTNFTFNEGFNNPAAKGYLQGASAQVMNTSANVSMIEIIGSSAANNGQAVTTVSNSFTISGNVTPDCSFFVGNVDRSINFGVIGIEANDNVGPASAFDMTAPATASVQTNVAGCNTRNRVTIAKGRATGMVSDNTAGFDQTQFTNELDYIVNASWQGSAPSGGAAAPVAETLNVGLNTLNNNKQQGAWKSVFNMNINVPVPTRSLLAGNYSDTITVTLDVI